MYPTVSYFDRSYRQVMMHTIFFDVRRIIIYSVYIVLVKGDVYLNVTSDTDKCSGSAINISCVLDPQITAVRILKPGGSSVVSCTAPLGGIATSCTPIVPYRIAVNKVGNTTTFFLTIPSLNKSIHNGLWKCIHGTDENSTAMLSVIPPLTSPRGSPIITVFPKSGGLVSNATISGDVFCQKSKLTSELLYANQDGVYKVLEQQPPLSESDAGNNGCDPGENNRTYTTTVTRTMSALKGKTVTFKIRFNQTECASSFTTDSSPVFFFPVPPNTNRTIINEVGNPLPLAEGEIVSLQCEVNGGVPFAMIRWNCFGGTVTNTSEDGIARSNITFTATSDQNGQLCTCSATHPVADIMNTSIQIYVTYKPKNVTLQPSSLTYVKHENQQLGPINCSADCNPVCSYTWSGPGSFMVNGPTLHITNIKRDQIGNYKCTASNSLDSKTSANIVVDIFYRPESVSLSPSKTNYVINETNNLGPIQCSADCHPNCSFIWTGPGSFISQGSVLTIDNIQKDKAGIYSCSANNTVGSASSNVTVVVNYSPKAVNLLPTRLSYTLNQSQSLGPIDCYADCHPNCTYNWSGPRPFRYDSYRLYVTNITKQHSGSYNCSAANILGTKLSGNVVVDVNYGPEIVLLQPPNNSYTINENQTLGPIYCFADCKPNCSYTWNGPRYTSSNNTLELDNIKRGHVGKYKCTATNILGSSNSYDVIVNVRYGPSLVKLIPSNTTYTLLENHPLGPINCTADCFPECIFKWNGPLNVNNSVLNISRIKRNEEGRYSCTAKNMFGTESSADVIVTVNYGPDKDIILNPPQSNSFVNETYRLGPIECNATCKPACHYKWKTPNSADKVGYKLNIDSIQRSQAGFYYCIASNSIGNRTSKKVNVTVNYAANITGMVISGNNFTVREHSTPTITCDAEGSPLPLITLRHVKNNTVIAQTTGLRLQHTLPYARCEDTGKYRCEAVNMFIPQPPVIEDVYILCAPRRIDNTNQKIAFASGVTLNISTIYLAYPDPVFIWKFRNDKSDNYTELVNATERVEINNRLEFQDVFQHMSILSRDQLKEFDFGTYTIVAQNSINKSIDSFVIVAEGKPNRPSNVKVNCTSQQSATLSWISEFNNGLNQSFYIHYGTGGEMKNSTEIEDPGHNKRVTGKISALKESSLYIFKIVSKNKNGTSHSFEVNCTSSSGDSDNILPAAIGGGLGSATFIIIVVIVFVFVLRRLNHFPSKKERDTEMNGRSSLTSRQYDENDEDDMRINELYVSAGPNFVKPGSSSGANGGTDDYKSPKAENAIEKKSSRPGNADVVYAVVQHKQTGDKNAKLNTKPIDPSATYAIVDKSQKSGKGGGKRKQKAAKPAPQVYENMQMERTKATNGNRKGPKTSGEKNEDGLIYVVLDLQEPQKVGSKFVIHGEENRTNYVEVDFTKRADPLPPEDETKGTIDEA